MASIFNHYTNDYLQLISQPDDDKIDISNMISNESQGQRLTENSLIQLLSVSSRRNSFDERDGTSSNQAECSEICTTEDQKMRIHEVGHQDLGKGVRTTGLNCMD
jgi:hypothetical protein